MAWLRLLNFLILLELDEVEEVEVEQASDCIPSLSSLSLFVCGLLRGLDSLSLKEEVVEEESQV